MSKFPVHVIPHADEVLTSWMVRMSSQLGTKYHTFCDFVFEGSSADTRDLDLNIKEEQLKRLEGLTYLPYAELHNLTIGSFSPNLSLDEGLVNWVLTKGKEHRVSRNNFTVYCPKCLSKDSEPYFRKSWRLITSLVCSSCEVHLVDQCPNCENPVSFLRLDIGRKEKTLEQELCICNCCGFDLRKTKVKKASKMDLKNQLFINKAIQRGYTQKLSYSHLFFDVLMIFMRALKSNRPRLLEFDKVVSRRMGTPQRIKVNKRSGELKNLKVEERHEILRKAMWVIQLKEPEFIRLCAEADLWGCFLRNESKERPYWFHRIVEESLSKKYFNWKNAYPEERHLSSYKRYCEKLLNQKQG